MAAECRLHLDDTCNRLVAARDYPGVLQFRSTPLRFALIPTAKHDPFLAHLAGKVPLHPVLAFRESRTILRSHSSATLEFGLLRHYDSKEGKSGGVVRFAPSSSLRAGNFAIRTFRSHQSP